MPESVAINPIMNGLEVATDVVELDGYGRVVGVVGGGAEVGDVLQTGASVPGTPDTRRLRSLGSCTALEPPLFSGLDVVDQHQVVDLEVDANVGGGRPATKIGEGDFRFYLPGSQPLSSALGHWCGCSYVLWLKFADFGPISPLQELRRP